MDYLKNRFSKGSLVCALIICALIGVSIWFGTAKASQKEFHKTNLAYLESKRDNAKALSGAASATSLLISMIPEDTATPIANQIAALGTHFLIVLSALTAEQSLLMITGKITFCYLLPLALLFLLLFVFIQRKLLLQIGVKLLVCGLAIYAVVPLTIQITRMGDSSYEEAVDKTLEQSQEMEKMLGGENLSTENQEDASTEGETPVTEAAGKKTEDTEAAGAEATGKKDSDSETALTESTGNRAADAEKKDSVEKNPETKDPDMKDSENKTSGSGKKPEEDLEWYEQAWNSVTDTANQAGEAAQDLADSAAEALSDTADAIADTSLEAASSLSDAASSFASGIESAVNSTATFMKNVPELPEKAAELLNSFIEAFVIMIVTTCILPIVILLGLIWILNLLLNIDPDWDGAKLYRSARKTSRKQEQHPHHRRED